MQGFFSSNAFLECLSVLCGFLVLFQVSFKGSLELDGEEEVFEAIGGDEFVLFLVFFYYFLKVF